MRRRCSIALLAMVRRCPLDYGTRDDSDNVKPNVATELDVTPGNRRERYVHDDNV